jgi:cytochrome P450
LQRADEARAQLDALLEESIARSAAGDSFLSETRGGAAQTLNDDEFVAQLRMIMFGAIETIRATLLNTVVMLHENPWARAALREDDTRFVAAIAESQRLVPPVAFVERWALTPLELDGVEIAAGEFIGVSVVGANRDPRVFDDPDAFRLDRLNAHRALTFSFGEHHCLGFHLARLQSSIAMVAMEEILGPYEVISADDATGFAFRRPESVRISSVVP